MNCPACGYYNPVGQPRCFHCELALPVGVGAGDARCAVHLDLPAAGACARCGTFGCTSCLSRQGDAWLCPGCTARLGVLPWDERETLGVWRAWWRTAVLLLTNPTQTLSTARADGTVGSSVGFATLSALVGLGPSVASYALVAIPLFLFLPMKGEVALSLRLLGPLVVLVYAGLLFGLQLLALFLSAGLDHLGLTLFGARPKAFSVTLRAGALSMGPYVLGLVPFCGLVVVPLWALVLRVMANAHLHGASTGKAAAAVLAPLVLLCGGLSALYLVALAALQAAVR